MRSTLSRRGKRMALAAVATFAVAGGIAFAAIPDAGTGVYHACMKKNGTIRIIDPAQDHCKPSNEVEITFNREGPKGDAGEQGPPGPQGPAGADGQDGKDGAPFSGTFTSPNGQYSISVTDTGIVLASPDSSIKVSGTEIRVESMGADTIEVRGGTAVNVLSGTGLLLRGGAATTVEAGAGLTLKGGGGATLEGGGGVTVKGGLVQLNPAGGCRPAARLGDDINTTVNKIVTGSPSVCVGG